MLLLASVACAEPTPPPPPAVVPPPPPSPAPEPAPVDPFEAWLHTELPPVAGFVDPVGSGWRRDGDAWTRAEPAPVFAMAPGRVLAADSGQVVVRHALYENHWNVRLDATYTGLDALSVAAGADVAAGDPLGAGRVVAVRLSADVPEVDVRSTRRFLDGHRSVEVPPAEPRLVLVHHDSYTMRFYEDGVQVGEYAVSFGQEPGAKEVRGDNRTPKGAYFVVERSRGPFGGDVAAFYGGIWVRIDYPNPWDAARGLADGIITAAQADAIRAGWSRRGATPKNTKLGGGIGFHAWASEWSDDGPRHLSWGCIVVHVADAEAVYTFLTEGTLVVLF